MRLPSLRRPARDRRWAAVLALAAAVATLLAGCAPPPSTAGGEGPPLPAPATGSATGPPATPATPSAGPTGAPPACGPPGVMLTLGPVDAASGLRVMAVRLRNCGTGRLTLHGYPAMRVLDAGRRLLPVTVLAGITQVSLIPEYDVPPPTVTLPPGGRALAVVAWRNTVTDVNVTATRAPYLQVAATARQPGQLLAPGGGLDVGTTGRVAVSPWLPDTTPAPSDSPTAPPTPLTPTPVPPTPVPPTVPPTAAPTDTRALVAAGPGHPRRGPPTDTDRRGSA